MAVSRIIGCFGSSCKCSYSIQLKVCVSKTILHKNKQNESTIFFVPRNSFYVYKVVSRVKNAKNKFRKLSRGAVTGGQLGGILLKVKTEQKEKEKKQVVLDVLNKKSGIKNNLRAKDIVAKLKQAS